MKDRLTLNKIKLTLLSLSFLFSILAEADTYYWECNFNHTNWDCENKKATDPFVVCANPFDEQGEIYYQDYPFKITRINENEATCGNGHHIFTYEDRFKYQTFRIRRRGVRCPENSTYQISSGSCISEVINNTPAFIEDIASAGKSDICPNPSNPINLKTGNKFQKELDYQSSDLLSRLSFKRYYNSQLSRFNANLIGSYWRSGFDSKILTYTDTSGTTPVWITVLYRDDGKGLSFIRTDGVWKSETMQDIELVEVKNMENIRSGWKLTDANDTVETYDIDGKLLSIEERNGFTQTLDYDLTIISGEGDDNSETLDRVTDHFGRTLHFKYHSTDAGTAYDGLLWKMIDPDGNEYIYDYDDIGNLEFVTYPTDDNSLVQRQYLYEDSNYPHALTGIVDENGERSHSWGYDEQGRAVFSEHGELGSGIDRYELTFNADGTTTLDSPKGQSQTYHFETHNYIHKISQIDGGQCTSCGGNTESTTYDANGHVDTRTDFRGTVTNYTMNSSNQEEQRIEAQGTSLERAINTVWHPSFNLPVTITQGDRQIDFDYNANGQLESRTVTETSSGETRTTNYDYTDENSLNAEGDSIPAGLLKSIDGPLASDIDITVFDYDVQGNIKTITDAEGNITEFEQYDAHGRPTEMVDINGNSIVMDYHPRGWLTSRTLTDALTGETYHTQYEYDNIGQLDKIITPAGMTLDYDYDAAHRLTDITDSEGHRIHYELDALGNRVGEEHYDNTESLRREVQRQYNTLNQLEILRSGLDPNDPDYWENGFAYDANGNQEFMTNGEGARTKYIYDALNRVHQMIENFDEVEEQTLRTTTYYYNEFDFLTSVEDPNGNITDYDRNVFGEVTRIDSPDTGIDYFQYDAAGNMTDENFYEIEYFYDDLNRLEFIYHADYNTFAGVDAGAFDIRYYYDSNTSQLDCTHGKGRLCRVDDNSGDTYFAYNALGNITERITVVDGVQYSTQATYNKDGAATSVTTPGGTRINYQLDTLNRVIEITDVDNNKLLSEVDYDVDGQLESQTLANQLQITNQYDLNGRQKKQIYEDASLTVGNAVVPMLPFWALFITFIILSFRLRQEQQARITAILILCLITSSYAQPTGSNHLVYDKNRNLTNNSFNGKNQTLEYDVFNRLTDEISTTETINYEYDANGNRESRDDGVSVVNYTIAPDSNRITDINGQATVYTDYFGNIYNDGTYSYSYSPTDRLETVMSQTNEVLAEYTYNYQNQRIKKVNYVKQETTIYHYDFNGLLLEETDETGASQIVYIYHNGIPKAAILKANSRYNASNEDIILSIVLDHLGTPRLALDENQTIVWEWQSDAFGTTPANEDPDEDGYLITLNLRFPGQYYDEETGLHYNWHRYYSPELGRYITSDPLGLAGGLNTYSYVSDNPINRVDPEGLVEVWWNSVFPDDFNTQDGYPSNSASSISPMSGSIDDIAECKGRWVQVGWNRLFNVICECVWLCLSCEQATAWSGNPNSIFLPRTVGTVVFNVSKSGKNYDPESGNDCICKNKPSREKSCEECD